MIPARKLIRIIVKKFWGACAFLLISLAVFVVIGRELSPKLNRYKDELADYFSEQLAVNVQIQAMQVDWSGLSPQLSLAGIELINSSGDTLLSTDKALLRLNILRSLANRNLAFDRLEASGVDMALTQNQDGVWGFSGAPWQTTASDTIDIDDPLDLFLLIRDVHLSDVQFHLTFRDGDEDRLNVPELSFANNGNFHRLNSSIVVDKQREAVSLILEFRGDPRALNNFSAKGYTSFDQVNIERVLNALPGDWQSGQGWWRGGEVTLESWFDIFAGGEILFRGRLDVQSGEAVLADNESGLKIPKAIGANFTGRLTARNILSFSLRDTVIDWPEFQAPLIDLEVIADFNKSNDTTTALELRTAKLDINSWLTTLQRSGLIRGGAQEAMQSLQPQGQLQNVKLSLDTGGNPMNFVLAANFDQFKVDSWRGSPTVDPINGHLQVMGALNDVIRGEIKVDSQQAVSLQFPTLYNQPMHFDGLTGQVNWQVNPHEELLRVNSGLLSMRSKEGDARGYFDLYVPLNGDREREQLILQLGMQNTLVKNYQKYVPSRLPRDFLDWLERSLGENGTITASGFLYRGGLKREMREQAELQLYADIKDSDLHYHPDWPPLKQASGKLWLDRLSVHGDIESGSLLNAKVDKLAFSVDMDAAQDQRLLKIDGSISGDASDGIALLQSDVLIPVIDHKLDAWQARGSIQSQLQLAIPIKPDTGDARQTVAVHMNGVDLTLADYDIEVQDIRGTIHYNERESLSAKEVRGRFLDREVVANIEDDKEAQHLRITVNGTNTIASLSQWAEINPPTFITGETTFAIDVGISNNGTELVLESDLIGIEVDLPAPLGKPAATSRNLRVQFPFGRANTAVLANYDDSLYGTFLLSNSRLRRGVVSTQANPQLPPGNQLLISGKLAHLDFDTWRGAYQQHFAKFNGEGNWLDDLPLTFAFDIDQFAFGDFEIANLALDATVRNQTADIAVNSERIAGDIIVYDHLSKPMAFNLSHLRLPRPKHKSPTWSDVFFPPTRPGDTLNDLDPATLPPFDFSVQELFYGEDSLGSWSFAARPVPNGVVANNITATFAEGRVTGLQPETGARLNWVNTGAGMETRIEGRFISSDLAGVLVKWNQPQLMQSEDAQFDFSLLWPGTPSAIATTALRGEVAVNLRDGSFPRSGEQSATDALLQLVSVLNFDTWMRRLRLDFSDLGRGGLAYDQVEGLLRFESGQVYLDKPIVVQTQSGEFQLTGVVDLENNQVDANLTATLPMGGNLTFLTALAAGLPAAAGVWVVSKIFDEQIDKVSTLSYSIEGPLDNPSSKFQRLFDSKGEATSANSN